MNRTVAPLEMWVAWASCGFSRKAGLSFQNYHGQAASPVIEASLRVHLDWGQHRPEGWGLVRHLWPREEGRMVQVTKPGVLYQCWGWARFSRPCDLNNAWGWQGAKRIGRVTEQEGNRAKPLGPDRVRGPTEARSTNNKIGGGNSKWQ